MSAVEQFPLNQAELGAGITADSGLCNVDNPPSYDVQTKLLALADRLTSRKYSVHEHEAYDMSFWWIGDEEPESTLVVQAIKRRAGRQRKIIRAKFMIRTPDTTSMMMVHQDQGSPDTPFDHGILDTFNGYVANHRNLAGWKRGMTAFERTCFTAEFHDYMSKHGLKDL